MKSATSRDQEIIALATEKGRLLARIQEIDKSLVELDAQDEAIPGISLRRPLVQRVFALMALTPGVTHRANDLARSVGSTPQVMRVVLSRLVNAGHIRRRRPGEFVVGIYRKKHAGSLSKPDERRQRRCAAHKKDEDQ